MKHLLRFLFYTVMLLCPLHAEAGDKLLGSYNLRVGETKTLSISDVMVSILGYENVHWGYTEWTSSNPNAVKIIRKDKWTCTVEAVAVTSTSAKIEYDVYWADGYLNWSHTKDYYYISVSPQDKLEISFSTGQRTLVPGESINLKLTPSVEGASIYYTLDGSTPTTSSTRYTSAGITIGSACTLKAIAVKSGYPTSDVYTATFSVAESWTAKSEEGVDMKFRVIDATAKTCELYSSIDKNTSGKVTIPSSVNGFTVTRIGSSVFAMCPNLTSVVIPSTVEEIGNSAFYECKNIVSMSLPNSLKNIGQEAFRDCEKLSSIEIPNSVVTIGSLSFEGCSGLTSVTIPNSVTTIGYRAFSDCSGLTSVVIANSVTSIEGYAFENCSALSSVDLGNSVTSIGSYAFYNCPSLTSLTIPESVKSIGSYAFYDSPLKSLKILSTELNSKSNAFSGRKLEELTVNLKRISGIIGGNEFTSLKIFTYSRNLEYIDSYFATYLNSSPWAATLPDGLNYIGKVLFKYKGEMPANTKIKVVEGCTQICDYAFSGQEGLTEISIPSSVAAIWGYALRNCKNLKTITVNEGNAAYDSRGNCNAIIEKATNTLIAGCSGTTIPSSVTSIGEGAFYGTIDWEEIIIPNQIDSIASNAFRDNANVKSILIGKGLRKIKISNAIAPAFSYLPNLKEIVVSASNPYFDSRDNCNAIIEKATNTLVLGCSNTNIPNTVKAIEMEAFWNTANEMAALVIPNSVEEIKRYAFDTMPKLKEVTIGANVKSFDKYSFYKCKNIISIESLNGFPDDIPDGVFDSEVYTNATLYVPEGCRNNYRLASGWNQFKNIVEGEMPSGIEQITMDSVSENGVVYSLSGQRLSAPQKGLNIINGKKYVVK